MLCLRMCGFIDGAQAALECREDVASLVLNISPWLKSNGGDGESHRILSLAQLKFCFSFAD